jgi:hypothetical protein
MAWLGKAVAYVSLESPIDVRCLILGQDISDNYIHVEKGTIHKESFWIPKYIADAFGGKTKLMVLR